MSETQPNQSEILKFFSTFLGKFVLFLLLPIITGAVIMAWQIVLLRSNLDYVYTDMAKEYITTLFGFMILYFLFILKRYYIVVTLILIFLLFLQNI